MISLVLHLAPAKPFILFFLYWVPSKSENVFGIFEMLPALQGKNLVFREEDGLTNKSRGVPLAGVSFSHFSNKQVEVRQAT